MHIACVEDNPVNMALVQRIAGMTKHTLVSYSEGEVAQLELLNQRFDLILHPGVKLSRAQHSRLVAIVGSPVNEQSQSEALDVLSLAHRAHLLSPPQSAQAQDAALAVLQTSPGPMVRLESARLLGHLGSAASVPALTLLLADPDPKVQDAARQALARSRK